MKSNVKTSSPAFNVMSWIALVGGILVYLIGLWRSDMMLNEKGYYFAVMLLGVFSSISLQKTVRDRVEEIPTSQIYYVSCVASFAISIILLAIGLWNADLLPSEKGFYAIAYFLCLFGSISVQKNVRDNQGEPDRIIYSGLSKKETVEED
ncbi:inner membrane protein YiaA [Enterobacter bugandensis]|uniref:Inner membrane protein YiaA n=1 Tax=Enterobacter bugandensis TaxID=881260 RepID=A0AA42PWA9_9ENTR|nr:inner membrane protein YiaA [Enterobacter bugandensis]MDH1319657.1 inner membrane protein YiaA [Enterobacter bugandensis]